MQRKSKRQAHSQFHNMMLRYNDAFWATGTPPNGWGCQCYRNQLTDSQAKAQGSIGVPPGIDTNSNILAEWRYDPGREMLAPNFTRYTALRKIKYKGKSANSQITSNYRKDMDGYKLTPGEWDAYVSNLPDDALPNKRLYADAMFGTLRSDAAEAIGEDVNLMAKDRSVIHGARARKKDDINLSQDQLKKLPKASSNPDAIYKDNATGNLAFRYAAE